MACVFLEIGQDVHFTGGSLEDAINEGVRQGYEEGYLRKSVVKDPLRRENTGDNTPASITYKLVEGDKVRIVFAPKGFGSENMSRIAPTSNPLEEDFEVWKEAVYPALNREERQILLIKKNDEIFKSYLSPFICL